MDGQALDILWILIGAVLVLMMQAGFACLESGLVRAKNSINVVMKNLIDFCVATVGFWALGFGIMFGASQAGWIGTDLFAFTGDGDAFLIAFFIFQLMFCGTATTIVSGAAAERMRFSGYLVTAALVATIVYPVFGHWAWGGLNTGTSTGWLGQMGFVDFAGSTVVHSIGGWMALAAIILLGPRLHRFGPDGTAFEGHNLQMSMLGVFLLWIGWFGFNGGSTLALDDAVPSILLNTALAAPAGGLAVMVLVFISGRSVRVEPIMNGVLAGLVAITANCHAVTPVDAMIIGAIGGAVCLGAQALLIRMHIDDAVGAVPVHLAAGIWGTLAVAIFGDPAILGTGHDRLTQLGVQALGVGAAGAFAFTVGFVVLLLVGKVTPLRVGVNAERIGLNVAEHGAGSALVTLIQEMETQRRQGDFRQPVSVQRGSEVGLVAEQYNAVLARVRAETDRREQAVLAMTRAKEEAEKASRAKSEFLASMSHELRTPLNAIMGFAEMIKRETSGPLAPPVYRDYAADILDSGGHLLGLINDLLDLSKIEARKFDISAEPMDLYQTAASVVRLLSVTAQNKGLTIELDVDEAIKGLHADERLVKQILLNLIANAVKFTPEGGRIDVIGSVEADGRIAVSVRDTGRGIARKDIQRVLEPFSQIRSGFGREQIGGTGLGLTLSKALTELHGGTLTITSEVGVGTTVTVRFPAERAL